MMEHLCVGSASGSQKGRRQSSPLSIPFDSLLPRSVLTPRFRTYPIKKSRKTHFHSRMNQFVILRIRLYRNSLTLVSSRPARFLSVGTRDCDEAGHAGILEGKGGKRFEERKAKVGEGEWASVSRVICGHCQRKLLVSASQPSHL